jgi:hypothetical protein
MEMMQEVYMKAKVFPDVERVWDAMDKILSVR